MAYWEVQVLPSVLALASTETTFAEPVRKDLILQGYNLNIDVSFIFKLY
jgi:hypothetical protein